MKLLSGLLGLLIFILAIIFAVANRADASISLWPFDTRIEAPLYLFTLGSLLIGILIGALIAWVQMLPHKRVSRRLRKDLNVMHARLEKMQNSLMPPRLGHSLSMLTRPRPRWKFWGPQ